MHIFVCAILHFIHQLMIWILEELHQGKTINKIIIISKCLQFYQIYRPPPKNAHTGTFEEIITPGGEVAFVKKMIDESIILENKIL